MCQIVFSLGYYGIKKTTKTNGELATESFEHNRCDFENSERDRWVLDGTDKCGTVCHGMSRSLLLIVSTEIMKIKIFYLENMDAWRFERDWDWCYARG